jgi:hypothetical protein
VISLSLRTPKRYQDCETGGINADRPCPYKACKHWVSNGGQCSLDYAKWGGMTVPEIATALDMTEQAVRGVLKRALKKLAKHGVLRDFYER